MGDILVLTVQFEHTDFDKTRSCCGSHFFTMEFYKRIIGRSFSYILLILKKISRRQKNWEKLSSMQRVSEEFPFG